MDAPILEASSETGTCPQPLSLPVALSKQEQEELETELSMRHDWIVEEGRQQREIHGHDLRSADFQISTTDPDATPMRLKNGGLHLGYHSHYVVDGGKRRIILEALVTPAEVMDNQPMLDLRLPCPLSLAFETCARVTGDTKYGTIENIKAMEDAGMRAYIPLPDWDQQRPPYFGPSKFTGFCRA